MIDAREGRGTLSLAQLGAARPLEGEGDGLWKPTLERVWSLGGNRYMVKWAELDEAEQLNGMQVTMLRRTAEEGHLPGLDDIAGLIGQEAPDASSSSSAAAASSSSAAAASIAISAAISIGNPEPLSLAM